MRASGSLGGTVYLGSTASPAPDGSVGVTLEREVYPNWSAVTTISTTSGGYLFEKLSAGNYRVKVAYLNGTSFVGRTTTAVAVLTSLTTQNVTLAAGYTVAGRVSLGAAGSAPPTGTMRVVLLNWFGDRSMETMVAADGTYSIPGVSGGSYEIRYEYLGDGPYNLMCVTSLPYTTAQACGYPGITFTADVANLNIVMPKQTGFTGTITDENGDPVANTAVDLYWGNAYTQAVTDANGVYRFFAHPGYAHSLSVGGYGDYAVTWWGQHGDYYEPSAITLTSKQWRTGIDIQLVRAGSLHGTVSGVRLADAEFVAVEIQVYDNEHRRWVSVDYVNAESNGAYAFERVFPDYYRLRAYYYGPQGEATMVSPVLGVGELTDVEWSPQLRPWTRDISGDEIADVLGRGASGNLVMYTGSGVGTLGPSSVLASGWNGYNAMVQAGDVDGDDDADIIARDTAGTVWLHEGLPTGGIESGRTEIAAGWKAYTYVLSPGDVNGDGFPDMMTLDKTGILWLHRVVGRVGWAALFR